VTINSIAQKRLLARRGIDSIVIPNVHDFSSEQPRIDQFNRDFRKSLGIQDHEFFVLQPTRVIQRKGIELAIELIHRLDLPNTRLFITHRAGDEGLNYWRWLQRESQTMGVDLQLIDHMIGEERARINGHKIYSLWDAYLHADMVTYPSLYEGFGNALLEAIYFKQMAVINRYPVYNADIKPLGFRFIELDGFVSENSVEQTRQVLMNRNGSEEMVDTNFKLAQEYFSLEVLERKLQEVIQNF
jgi:glycosyltransferase involved in cell wall biosynthesis